MKRFIYSLFAVIFLLHLGSCSEDIENQNINNEAYRINNDGNELVFDVTMGVNPIGEIDRNDTLWLTCNITDELFVDKVSGKGYSIPLNETEFTCQLQLVNRLRNAKPEFYLFAIEGSSSISDNNLITLKFGYPNKSPKLKVGIVLSDIGVYTLNFINYPNPLDEEQLKNSCDDNCSLYWHDLQFNLNPNNKEFYNRAFVEYHFNASGILTGTDNINQDYNNAGYLNSSIYNDAVYTFSVY